MGNVKFITGAVRGFGAGIAKAGLATGDNIVTTGWNTTTVTKATKALGSTGNLLAVTLDMTRAYQIKAVIKAAVERFGRGRA